MHRSSDFSPEGYSLVVIYGGVGRKNPRINPDGNVRRNDRCHALASEPFLELHPRRRARTVVVVYAPGNTGAKDAVLGGGKCIIVI